MGDTEDMRKQEIFKTNFLLQDPDGIAWMTVADTISFEGKLWLVPKWLENPTLGYSTPGRSIRLDNLEYSQGWNAGVRDYTLHDALPRSLIYDDPIPLKLRRQYEVRESLNVPFPSRSGSD